MTTEQQKAEAYVREQLPELYEYYCKSGCGCSYPGGDGAHEYDCVWSFEPLPIQLNHWLQVLDKQNTLYELCNSGVMYWNVENRSRIIHFDLTTGQPETELNYQKFNEIVGIN